MANKPEHLDELNLVRAMAILGVLMVHSTSVAVGQMVHTKWLSLYNFANIFSKFGTPTFIFLSSFVLFYNYYHRPFQKELFARFYRNRLLYIVAPYIIFSAIYYVVKGYRNFGVDSLSYTLARFIKLLLTGHAHDHLYFVVISVQFYIAFPALLYFFQKVRWARISAIFFGLALQWSFLLLNRRYFHITNKGSLCISWISYFFLGVFFGIYFNRIKEWVILKKNQIGTLRGAATLALWLTWTAAAFLHIGLWYQTRSTGIWRHSLLYEALYNLYGLTSALVLFQLSFAIYRHASQSLVRIMFNFGSVSFGVYLFHPLVLRYYRHFQPVNGGAAYHLWIAGGFLCAILISWAVVRITTRYFKLSWLLFGNVSNNKPRFNSKPILPISGSVKASGAETKA